MKTPINSQTLRQHLTYSWWKYALAIIASVFAVNLYFTVSSYRSPEEKKVLLYVYGTANETAMNDYLARVQENQMPDMEEMYVLMLTADNTYGPMQLSTYVAAGEGDLYILPRDEFVSMSSTGAWVALEDEEELTSLFSERGLSLQSGWRRDTDSGVSHLYGIPISRLPGLEQYVYVENGYLCMLITNGNDENVMKFLKIFCEDMLEAPSAEASEETPASEEAAPEATEETKASEEAAPEATEETPASKD